MNTCRVKHLKPVILTSFIAAALSGCDTDVNTDTDYKSVDTDQPRGWVMVWNDEFDQGFIDDRKWTHEVDCWGGGNNEQQCYSDSPDYSYVKDGMLHLVAKHNGYDGDGNEITEQGKAYTSARINTKYKGDWKYGRFEMRAKMPAGQGTFPAFWMLPTEGVYGEWPLSGEIDILETVNLKARQMRVAEDGETPVKTRWDTDWVIDTNSSEDINIYGTLHYGKPWPDNMHSGQAYQFPDGSSPADDFHTYAVEWDEGEIRWYADGYLYATQRKSETILNSKGEMLPTLLHKGWYTEIYDMITGEVTGQWTTAPYDQEFHIILNNAVGGDWSENTNEFGVDASAFAEGNPFIIDYVRVYECSANPETGKGCETTRLGYDMLPTEDVAAPEYALVEGEAPNPPAPPTDAVPQDLVLFADDVANGWIAWDCCGGSNPAAIADAGDGYGAAVQFDVLNGTAGTVFGFSTRSGHSSGDLTGSDTPYDGSGIIDTGSITFDMKVLAMPADPSTAWLFKIESNENSGGDAVELTLMDVDGNAPQDGVWQSYSFTMKEIADAGLNPSAIDVLMVFPAWGAGDGASFLVDNMVIDSGVDSSSPSLVLFEDSQNAAWPAWDCCGGTTPPEVEDDAEHGTVVEFSVANGNDGTVFGFNTKEVDSPEPFDATGILTNGVVQFDLKPTAMPADGTAWLFKIESNGATQAVEWNLSLSNEGAVPVLDVWQTYTFNISDLVAAGLDASAIDVVMAFPAWGAGDGAVFRMDNVKIYDPTAPVGGNSLTVFTESEVSEWPLWDCCGGTTPAVVDSGDEHGNVAQFEILDNNGTVLGFNTKETDTPVPFDASNLVVGGVVQFDMKAVSMPADGTDWRFKIESGDTAFAAELSLSDSNEGVAPAQGVWQTYTFNLSDLVTAGLTDMSAIDVLMIFPAWGAGQGAVYQVDNVRIYAP